MPESKKTTSGALEELRQLVRAGIDGPSASGEPRETDIPRTAEQVASTDEIVRARAYEVWERSGHQPGRDLENWLQAEAEVRGHVTSEDP